MNQYDLQERIGQGTFGDVFAAVKKSTNEKVSELPRLPQASKLALAGSLTTASTKIAKYAIKCLKKTFPSWSAATQEREFRAIWGVLHDIDAIQDQHLVRVYDICLQKDKRLYFVMEYMKDGTLHQYVEHQKTMATRQQQDGSQQCTSIPEMRIQSILFQCLQGLRFIHWKGYIHRDIKPENIMMHGDAVKIGDLSLARRVQARGRQRNAANMNDPSGTMTTYVATRWYRAPELLREDPIYSCVIDIFALGCVFAELYSFVPLFQGENNSHQLKLIAELLSRDTFSLEEAQSGSVSVVGLSQRAAQVVEKRLAKQLPTAETVAIDLMSKLLEFDPRHRLSADRAMQHHYFRPRVSPDAPPPKTELTSTISARTPTRMVPGRQHPLVTESKAERKRRRQEEEERREEQEPNELVRAFLHPKRRKIDAN